MDLGDLTNQTQIQNSREIYVSNDAHISSGYEPLVGLGVALGGALILTGAYHVGKKIWEIAEDYIGRILEKHLKL